MRLRNLLLVALGLGGAVAVASSCVAPTEILLDVRTNIPCTGTAKWQGVSVSVGEPGVDVESRAPVLTTTACTATGEVGTLVIVPTGSNTAEVGIRVVAGITKDPESCAAGDYTGCVVSRRTLTYLSHQTENVVVDLTSDCIGNACDLNHTCVEGACTDTVTAEPPVALDGGVVKPPSDAGDAVPKARDAAVDAGPTVRCGDNGTRCPANNLKDACCVTFDFDAGTSDGKCMPALLCPSTSAVLYCDDSSECAPVDGGEPAYCVASYIPIESQITNAACVPASVSGGGSVLCQARQPCPASGNRCGPWGPAPGYFECGPA